MVKQPKLDKACSDASAAHAATAAWPRIDSPRIAPTWVRQARGGRRRVLRGIQAQQVIEPALHLVAQRVPAVPSGWPGQQYQGSSAVLDQPQLVAYCLANSLPHGESSATHKQPPTSSHHQAPNSQCPPTTKH
jgi:hypothetical protein